MKRLTLGALAVCIVGAALLSSRLWAAAPSCRYVISTDTVLDTGTGLTWQRAVPATTLNWSDGSAYCQGLSLGGFSTGWRLPTKGELESIVDFRASSPSIDATTFPGTPVQGFWTSTPIPGTPGSVFILYFKDGNSTPNAVTETGPVRCVH